MPAFGSIFRVSQQSKNLNKVTIKVVCLLNTMLWKKAHTTLIDSIGHPVCSNCCFLNVLI